MSEFKGFSEATKLFAANLNVVNAMKDLFEQDLTSYLDALAQSISDRLEPALLKDEAKSAYRYWWIDKSGVDRKQLLELWFRSKPAEVVTKNKLTLHIYVEDPSPERLAMVKQIPEMDKFREFCRPGRDIWSLVNAEITCQESDLIEGPSRLITDLLRELHRIDCTVREL